LNNTIHLFKIPTMLKSFIVLLMLFSFLTGTHTPLFMGRLWN